MSVFAVLGIVVLGVTASALIKEHHPALALCLSIAVGILLLLGCLDDLVGVIERIKELLGKTGVETAFFSILLKTLGICYICQFAGDLCKDAGESALAGYVELAGKITVIGLSLPLLTKVVETVIKLIGV